MVGRDLDTLYPKQETEVGEVALRSAAHPEGVFTDVSFEVRRGEIVASPGWSGRDAARSPAPSSAWTAGTPGPSR
ncbi:hypothetical protein GCM10018952_63280 [Streptosporangium vulgare]